MVKCLHLAKESRSGSAILCRSEMNTAIRKSIQRLFGDKIEQCQRADIEDDILGEIKAAKFCDMTRRKFIYEYEKILEELLKEEYQAEPSN
jgi:hypothetical protein